MSRIKYVAFSKSGDVDFADLEAYLLRKLSCSFADVTGKDSSATYKAIQALDKKFSFCRWVDSPDQLSHLRFSYANDLLHIHCHTDDISSELCQKADLTLATNRISIADQFSKIISFLDPRKDTSGPFVDVIVGGQYGSEGKGQIAAYLSHEYDLLIRVGGPNAGHKVFEIPTPYTFHLLPSGSRTSKDSTILIGPGAVLDEQTIIKEIEDLGPGRSVFIDPQCMIIESGDKVAEGSLVSGIGSTGQGVGSATSRRIMGRSADTKLAKDIERLKPFIKPSLEILSDAYSNGKKILLEGTQGTSLSLFHGCYPYVTSRDTSVSGCISEAGISPRMVRKIIMVCRTYPIRVQNPKDGTSGPMGKEISWDEVAERSGIPSEELKKAEKTSTTKKDRRVAEFSWEQLKFASDLNLPTDIALTFADYISVTNREAVRFEQLTSETQKMINEIEMVAKAEVSMVASNFNFRSIIDRRKWGR